MVVIEKIEAAAGHAEGIIRVGRRQHHLGFDSRLELSDRAAEAFLLLALPAAMRHGGPLVMEAPVSPRLLAQVPAIQDLYQAWDAGLRRVEVKANPRLPAGQPPVNTASGCHAMAFTGGVDSFYAALQNPQAALVYIHGLDIPLHKRALRTMVSSRLSEAAAALGRPWFEMETSLRDFSDRYFTWSLAFGGALAACALLLSRHFETFGIPAGQAIDSDIPDGAHTRLVRLFTTEELEVRAAGCDARRIDKVSSLAHHPVARRALRVCWENRGDAYNCGACEKCLRTMASLEIFGALRSFSTFPLPLDYRRLSWAVPHHPGLQLFIQENLEAARARQSDPRLIRSLEIALDRTRSDLIRTVCAHIPRPVRDFNYRVLRRAQPAGPAC